MPCDRALKTVLEVAADLYGRDRGFVN